VVRPCFDPCLSKNLLIFLTEGLTLRKNDDSNGDLMGDITKDFNLDEEIKKNPGFGKPLPSRFFKGDVYSNFLNTGRQQGFQLPWVKLQKEIKEQLAHVLSFMEKQGIKEMDLDEKINQINTKIRKYNLSCPPQLQRGLVKIETLRQQAKHWD
jgi:hypothetical protein